MGKDSNIGFHAARVGTTHALKGLSRKIEVFQVVGDAIEEDIVVEHISHRINGAPILLVITSRTATVRSGWVMSCRIQLQRLVDNDCRSALIQIVAPYRQRGGTSTRRTMTNPQRLVRPKLRKFPV